MSEDVRDQQHPVVIHAPALSRDRRRRQVEELTVGVELSTSMECEYGTVVTPLPCYVQLRRQCPLGASVRIRLLACFLLAATIIIEGDEGISDDCPVVSADELGRPQGRRTEACRGDGDEARMRGRRNGNRQAGTATTRCRRDRIMVSTRC